MRKEWSSYNRIPIVYGFSHFPTLVPTRSGSKGLELHLPSQSFDSPSETFANIQLILL